MTSSSSTPAAPSLLPTPLLVAPLGVVAPADTSTIYIGKIPATLPAEALESLLARFRPALRNWRRAKDPQTGVLKAFGFADFADAAQADVAMRVFEALDIPSSTEEGGSGAEGAAAAAAAEAQPPVHLLVQVDAETKKRLADSAARAMAAIALRLREEEKEKLASLPPGMEAVREDDAAVLKRAEEEFTRCRTERIAKLVAEANRLIAESCAAHRREQHQKAQQQQLQEELERREQLLGEGAAAAADSKQEEQELGPEEKRRRLELANQLLELEAEEQEKARQHRQREKERQDMAYARHEYRYRARERERLRRIEMARASIHGVPAHKRKYTLSARERAEERMLDDQDREEEEKELQQQQQQQQQKSQQETEQQSEQEQQVKQEQP